MDGQKGKVPFRIVDRDDGDSRDRRLLEENWMEAGREEEEATRCEGTLVSDGPEIPFSK